MTCPACGTRPSARDRFCRHCGTRLKSNRASTIVYHNLAVFVGALGVVTFVMAIRSDQSSKYPIGAVRLLNARIVRDVHEPGKG